MSVRQDCPLRPTLFDIFSDRLHDHLQAHAPSASVQLRSGHRVCLFMYADDVALLSWTQLGLPVSACFKYLSPTFHESGSMAAALA